MNWMKRFMAGRYGADQLSVTLLIVSLVLSLAASITGLPVLMYLGYIPLGLCLYRMLSRDMPRRRMENYRFAMFVSPLYSWASKKVYRIKDMKMSRYFKCPGCRAELRVPRGKGKINICCPKCKTEFIKKT